MSLRSVVALVVLGIALSGCAIAAAPCRVTGAVAKVVPLVGDPVGETLEACADVID